MISSNTKDTVSVVNFSAGKSVFVTGGTGFLGKLLIEKLLWSCPGIENIYMLIRSKKNNDQMSRLNNILTGPVFERLRKTRPQDLQKIIPISGDLSKAHMDISSADKETLINKVAVVFHVAATLRFDETLKSALAVNTVATCHLYELCNQMHNVKAFIYVSTAYSNHNLEEVKEEIYSIPYEPDKIITLMEILKDDIAETVTSKLLEEHPNTYTFTKAVAENMLKKCHTKIPIAIIRPSIVLSTLEEPVIGWNDSWNGLTAFAAGCLIGFSHGMVGNGRMIADFIPADYVVNLIICAAWRTANISNKTNIEVFNCCSGQVNPITWGEFGKYFTHSVVENPAKNVLSYPHFRFQTNKILLFLQIFFLDKVLVYLIDGCNFCIGKKPMLVKFHRKLMTAQDAIMYFTTRQWKFLDNNTQNLSNLLSDNDKKIFPFDVSCINWPTYIRDFSLGVRHYMLKQSPDSLPQSRNRLKKVKWILMFIPCLLVSTLYLLF